jgi:hypothetical protein
LPTTAGLLPAAGLVKVFLTFYGDSSMQWSSYACSFHFPLQSLKQLACGFLSTQFTPSPSCDQQLPDILDDTLPCILLESNPLQILSNLLVFQQ